MEKFTSYVDNMINIKYLHNYISNNWKGTGYTYLMSLYLNEKK